MKHEAYDECTQLFVCCNRLCQRNLAVALPSHWTVKTNFSCYTLQAALVNPRGLFTPRQDTSSMPPSHSKLVGYIFLFKCVIFHFPPLQYAFDYNPKRDVFACVADIGWITGHSYVVYGPLCNGGTTVLFESHPLYPNPGEQKLPNTQYTVQYQDYNERGEGMQFSCISIKIKAKITVTTFPARKTKSAVVIQNLYFDLPSCVLVALHQRDIIANNFDIIVGRYWEMVERLKITHFYTAPTAIRMLLRHEEEWVTKYNRSSLKILGCGMFSSVITLS